MTGGVISENTASGVVGVGAGMGGGVRVTGTFTMNDGVIRGNTADYGGGVSVSSSGYSSNSTFTMNGGEISGNTAGSSYYGGGVYVGSYNDGNSTFIKTGPSIIYGDTDTTHTVGADENTALGGRGHAVYWDKSPSSKMRNATLRADDNLNTNDLSTNWD